MRVALKHREIDGYGSWHDHSACFGHLMLHSTPESLHETLPWQDPISGLVIVADARIDNRPDLIASLNIDRASAEFLPDSHLILAAYRKWDEDCVLHLLGDFAFAIWDQANKTLFCARDHLGIRPFYYHVGAFFAFASSALAVRRAPGVPQAFNEGRIADYLVQELEGVDKTSTFFKHIFRLPPAHTARLESGRLRLRQYWLLDPEFELNLASDEAYLEAFNEVFTSAIDVRLRCNGQPASMLSGGIDSSSIVGWARKSLQAQGAGPLRTFSAVTDDEDCVETHYIQQMIGLGGLDPVLLRPGAVEDLQAELAQVYAVMEDPFDCFMVLQMVLYLSARQRGNRVMLDGVDGDLVTSQTTGYPAFLIRQEGWHRARLEMRGMWENFYRKERPLWKLYLQMMGSAFVPDFIRRCRRQWFGDHWERLVLRPAPIAKMFAQQVRLSDRVDQYRNYTAGGVKAGLRQSHIDWALHASLTAGIERYQRVAAYCGVEARHPLMDKRLVEFCVSLPWDQKVRNGWIKYALRRSAETVAPPEIAWRQTWEHLGHRFLDAWMTQSRARVDGLIATWGCTSSKETRSFIDKKKFSKLCQEYNVHDLNSYSRIWGIANLHEYYQKHQRDRPSQGWI